MGIAMAMEYMAAAAQQGSTQVIIFRDLKPQGHAPPQKNDPKNLTRPPHPVHTHITDRR